MRAQLKFKDFPLLNEVMFMVIVDEYSIYMTCVASTMCASPRNVIIPTPTHPTPRETSRVRSIKHVCKC